MDKKQTKERDSIVDEISKSREKMIFDRDSAFKAQQKREEKLMKQFQVCIYLFYLFIYYF